MENNENFAEQAENVEQTTEETPKMFTQDEVNEIVGKSKARERAKIEKQYQREYGELIDVLETGTGKKGIGELKSTFLDFYTQKGITPKKKPELNNRDVEVLGMADADEIIRGGIEDVEDEVDRLNNIGEENLTDREKVMRNALSKHIKDAEIRRELGKIGVTEDVYNSAEFNEFRKKFNSNTPITDVYDIFRKTQPKKEIRTMGSMKQSPNTGAKDYYTPEEIERLSMKDLDDPQVWAAVRRSMTGK